MICHPYINQIINIIDKKKFKINKTTSFYYALKPTLNKLTEEGKKNEISCNFNKNNNDVYFGLGICY
jgi:hypothetical protein